MQASVWLCGMILHHTMIHQLTITYTKQYRYGQSLISYRGGFNYRVACRILRIQCCRYYPYFVGTRIDINPPWRYSRTKNLSFGS